MPNPQILLNDFSSERHFLTHLGFDVFGLKPARPEEVMRAAELLAAAPQASSGVDVARYFAELTEKNSDGELYNAEWTARANPLIVSFFKATNYGSPSGDQTPWCAAFVNWCLQRASRTSTHSASSGSFRCFGEAAGDPEPGDIAVFKNPGQDAKCSGSGHVAFWLSAAGDSVQVLGGNQRDSIRVSRMAAVQDAGSPWLVTVRKAPPSL
jgi:uncharacterized protein (TIGR02594 family)